MQEERTKLSDRLLNFGASIIKLVRNIKKGTVESHIVRQIIRSATSAGANYEEACSGESRADFIHKLQIVLKELNETMYWLRLIEKSQIQSGQEIKAIILENKELCSILARSVITAKNRTRNQI